jgi:preprotein translocase subunit YajC
LHLFEFLAQTVPSGVPPAPTSQPVPWWVPLFQNPLYMIVIAMVVFFLFTNKSKGNQEKQRKQMLEQLKKGDRIQTIGGVLGTVVEAKENEVVVKVDENANTKMRFTRSAIHRVIEAEKAEK